MMNESFFCIGKTQYLLDYNANIWIKKGIMQNIVP